MHGGAIPVSWLGQLADRYLVGDGPLYSPSVLAAFFAARFTTVFVTMRSPVGLFMTITSTSFLIPPDLLWSFA